MALLQPAYLPIFVKLLPCTSILLFMIIRQSSLKILIPKFPYFKGVTDFYCAIKYIVENAESFGIDPDRIGKSIF